MKTKKLLPCYVIIYLVLMNITFVSAQTGGWSWAKTGSGATADEYARCVTTDASNNAIVVGSFQSPTITFGSTTLTNNTSTSNYGDVFVAKYDASGGVLWAKRAGGNNQDEATSVSSDAIGNVYVTGYFLSASITFGSTTLTNAGGSNYYDIFIVKYDSNGNVIWAKRAGGTSEDYSYDIKTDATGNSYIVGYYYTSITFGSITLNNGGALEMFVAKYDNNGNAMWAKTTDVSSNAKATAVSIDAGGNVIVAGLYLNASITFGTTTLTNAAFNSNDFLVKYSGSGTVIWAVNIGGDWDEIIQDIACNTSGDIIIGGRFNSTTLTIGSTVLTNAGGTMGSYPYSDAFIAKYNSSGSPLWAERSGGNKEDFITSVSTDAAGNVIAVGAFGSLFITWGTTTLNNVDFSTNSTDLFVVKFDAAGTMLWAKSAGGSNGDDAQSVATDASGNIYVAGRYYSSSIVFGSSTLTNSSANKNDIFLAKSTSVTGIAEEEKEKLSVQIFPNPFFTITTIAFEKELKNVTLKIYDLVGKELKTFDFSGDRFIIEKGEMKEGVYFIHIIDENKNFVNRRIVIQ